MSAPPCNGYGPVFHPEEDKDLLERSTEVKDQCHFTENGNPRGSDVIRRRHDSAADDKAHESERFPFGLVVIDHVVCGLIVAPLVVAFWWSLWDLMDLVVFPDNYDLSLWVCVAVGCIFNGFAYSLQEWTLKRAKKADLIERLVLHNLYVYLFGASTISLWRGIWNVWDHYSGITPISVTISIVISCATLIPLRAFRAAKSPPLLLCNDWEFEDFECTTRFGRKFKDGKTLYILDNLFTAWVIHPLYVTMWRGIWTAMDLIIYPENIEKSIWVTLTFGYILTVICYLLQIPSYYLYKLITHKKGSVIWKILVDDIVHIFVHIATIAVWRGWWELFAHYIPGTGGTLRLWISSVISIIILMGMQTGNSVLGHGCEVDGQEDPAPFFYIYYTRYFIDLRRQKSAKKQTQSKNDQSSNEKEQLEIELKSFVTSC